MAGTGKTQAGFSAIELMVVLAIIGVMVSLAVPGFSTYETQQNTRESARNLAELLGNTRSEALEDGVPYLVYFNDVTAASGAVVVRDNDASYSITPGDSTRPVLLFFQRKPDVHTLGEVAAPAWMNSVPVLSTEPSITQVASGGSSGGPGPSSSSRPGPGPNSGPINTGTPSVTSTPTLGSGLQKGTSFPLDLVSSRPALAFNTRGLPVSPNSPNTIGSGAGVFYLTSSQDGLFGVSVNPLGKVGVRQWNRQAQTWN